MPNRIRSFVLQIFDVAAFSCICLVINKLYYGGWSEQTVRGGGGGGQLQNEDCLKIENDSKIEPQKIMFKVNRS